MNEEILRKLLNSSNWEDRLIGFNFCKNLSFEEFVEYLENIDKRNLKFAEGIITYRWNISSSELHEYKFQINLNIIIAVYTNVTYVYNKNPYGRTINLI